MASAYSTDLKLELMVTGENSGTWGDKTNTNLNLVQQAIAGYEAIDVASADVTLAMTNATLSNARNMVLNLTGTLAANRSVNVPDGIEKTYIVADSTTRAGFTLTIKTVSGTGVAIPAGKTVLVFADGTNVVDVFFMKDLVEDTTPQLGGNLDANGNNILIDNGNFIGDENGLEQVKFATTASAVNELTITNAATGNAPEVSATGGDTNVDLNLTPKGIGRTTFNGQGKIQSVAEKVTTEATAATGTVNYDVLTQAVWNFTTDASGNWTLNVRGDGSNSLDSIMDTGESITIAHIVSQGATAYYNNAFTIDGSSVTPEWQGGSAPTEGNVSSLDTYTYTIIKTASATFTVLAAQTQFA
jgi:hypothetical protein